MPRVAPARPDTAPFPSVDPGELQNGQGHPTPRRSPWWKRIFGR